MPLAFITGSAGFIGFHLAQTLLSDGWDVIGLDCLNDYYDVSLKEARHARLQAHKAFKSIIGKLEDDDRLEKLLAKHKPDVVVHLAAQAGVRFSIDAPRTYLNSNLHGTFELLEAARNHPPKHLLIASTSSVYGANEVMPYREIDKVDTPMSFYAATKKATEAMAHSYSHLYRVPTTMFRFFTVYGPWGRPDMAHFKFTRAIFRGEPIDVYNHGQMSRDFTYIDDLVEGIMGLMDAVPTDTPVSQNDSLSPVAPFRVVNIGSDSPTRLMDYIEAIERAIGKTAQKTMHPMQAGDVPETWADVTLLKELTGVKARVSLDEGIQQFVDWYRDYYRPNT